MHKLHDNAFYDRKSSCFICAPRVLLTITTTNDTRAVHRFWSRGILTYEMHLVTKFKLLFCCFVVVTKSYLLVSV